MTIDVYTSTGTKKGTASLPKALFEIDINDGLMHQAVVRSQANKRRTVAHVKRRGDIQGSTKKLFAQKGTGRARRGSVRSPLLRGGSKSFGPNKKMNFSKDMPRKMRQSALRSALSAQAKAEAIIGLENYPTEIKTKAAHDMLTKMPVELGRKILIVMPEKHADLMRSVSNIPNVQTVMVQYLNPEDVLGARHIVFMVDALKTAEELFGSAAKAEKKADSKEEKEPAKKETKKATTKKATTSKK